MIINAVTSWLWVTGPKGHWSKRYGINLCSGDSGGVDPIQLFVDLMTLIKAL